MRCPDENRCDEAWTKHDRHFFIVTDAARPVSCCSGNEVNITPLRCTIVTITGEFVRDGNQKLERIVAGATILVFYLPMAFLFVAISSAQVPESVLLKELQVLEWVIFSILTRVIGDTLKKLPHFDIKQQTCGAERMFTAVLHFMDHAHSFIFHNYVWLAPLAAQGKRFGQAVCTAGVKSVLAIVFFMKRMCSLLRKLQDFIYLGMTCLSLRIIRFGYGFVRECLDSDLVSDSSADATYFEYAD
jgi:hypothetical protein